ncbi:ATP-dependent DNA helicase [Portibacter marinus]|uniref:ATP-dependent DNA helicase n=1 Tax=Portibacter marinus TaxID=2898660 RepID=UPI001F454854|nr:DEAD/DEAH box helicase [Portibacter marinus]
MIGSGPLALSSEHQEALDLMEHGGDHLFVTGRAGTGKSTLLQLFAKTTSKKHVVLAPTGIAALNVGGQTIHSFFGFPPKLLMREDIQRRKNYRMFLNIEVIIIDEISMVRADMMDNIDWFLRVNRGTNVPFGGVRMILFGDLFQLPPVVGNKMEAQYLVERYDSPYFFSALVWRNEAHFEMIELQEVYRQDERHFINILDSIRTNEVDEYVIMDLNERHSESIEENEFIITLSSRNAIVNEINIRHLSELFDEEYTYLASVSGNFPPSSYPAELALKLKKGTQVMFVKNDPEKRFVNGTLGIVKALSHEEIIVEIVGDDGMESEIKVPKLVWEIQKYRHEENQIKSEVVGSFEQYPLKMAWAITIHKSQGKTFDNVIIDVGTGSFEYGQTYVALSRCRSLEGIQLKRKIRPRDIFVDEKIVDFYQQKKRG